MSTRRDFREVYSRGRRNRSDGVTVIGARSPSARNVCRLGFVVPGGVGTAVVRNRIRRRLREAVAVARPAAGFDVVIRADAEVADTGFQQLVGDVREALVGAGIECGG